MKGNSVMTKWTKLLVGVAFSAGLVSNLPAQSIYATLTGVVSDPTQALVAQATVKLKDEQSGSQRETVTNGEGYYTFASVPPGSYELTIEAKGIDKTRTSGIALGGGEKRNENVTLKVGSTTETGEVTTALDQVA